MTVALVERPRGRGAVKVDEPEPFDVGAFIRSVADEFDTPDRPAIAAKVAVRMPATHKDEALRYLVAVWLRVYQPRLGQALGTLPDHHDEPPPRVRSGHRNYSGKVARQKQRARMLATELRTADGTKVLGECNVDDLEFAAIVRHEKARENLRSAEMYEDLAALLRQHRKAKVRLLPDAVLDAFLAKWRQHPDRA